MPFHSITPWLHSLLLMLPVALAAAQLPDGFQEERIATGLNPTTMTFAPDGRLFVLEKTGLVRLVKDGALQAKPVLDLEARVDPWGERGLLALILDPQFARNGWFYLYYTAKEPKPHNRVSRFTLRGSVADPASEQVIFALPELGQRAPFHIGGGIRFGRDGKLYISTGDNGRGPNAQAPASLMGKLLRLNPDGSVPDDQPQVPDLLPQVVGLGFRNAWTMAVQPSTGLLYIIEAGQIYEEINRYDTAAPPIVVNYGWPGGTQGFDGPSQGRTMTGVGTYRDAELAYRTDKVCITGGDFYEPAKPGPGAFPASFRGRYLWSDYKGWIKSLDPAKPEQPTPFAAGIPAPTDLEVAPDGTVWYLARNGPLGGPAEKIMTVNAGELWRIRYNGPGGLR